MLIITMLAQKGGVGRSMLSRSFAVQGLIEGRRAAIVDCDPQGTCIAWGRRRGESQPPAVVSPDGRPLDAVVRELGSRGADLIIVDTPPHTQPVINAALATADAAILVTGPYPEDLEQVGAAAAIAKALGKPTAIVLNKTPAKASALALARSALSTFAMPICPVAITQLVSHPYASAEGFTAQEREPNGRAAGELIECWSWLKTNLLGSSDHRIQASQRPSLRVA